VSACARAALSSQLIRQLLHSAPPTASSFACVAQSARQSTTRAVGQPRKNRTGLRRRWPSFLSLGWRICQGGTICRTLRCCLGKPMQSTLLSLSSLSFSRPFSASQWGRPSHGGRVRWLDLRDRGQRASASTIQKHALEWLRVRQPKKAASHPTAQTGSSRVGRCSGLVQLKAFLARSRSNDRSLRRLPLYRQLAWHAADGVMVAPSSCKLTACRQNLRVCAACGVNAQHYDMARWKEAVCCC